MSSQLPIIGALQICSVATRSLAKNVPSFTAPQTFWITAGRVFVASLVANAVTCFASKPVAGDFITKLRQAHGGYFHAGGPRADRGGSGSNRENPDNHPLPTFTRTLDFNGVAHTVRIVGTDPLKGPRTTHIKTLIVPLRLDIGNGTVLDASKDLVAGRTPVDWVLQSPFFNDSEFFIGSKSLGKHQFADQYVRANFWSEGGSDPRYHLILDPEVAPTQTLNVPADKLVTYDWLAWPGYGINFEWLREQQIAVLSLLNPDPATLVIFLVGHNAVQDVNGTLAGGTHDAYSLPTRPNGPLQTFITASFIWDWSGGELDPNVGLILSHEILEWINDPFTGNRAPPWVQFQSISSEYLEVADPVDYWTEATDIFQQTTAQGLTYLMEDSVFLDWFTRKAQSRSIDGLYSFNGRRAFSEAPYDTDRFEIREFRAPGSQRTYLYGISGKGDMAGQYLDRKGKLHGLLVVDGQSLPFDVPGAAITAPGSINSNGDV